MSDAQATQSADVREIIRRLQRARMHMLEEKPFFALLLTHVKFSLDVSARTAYTDGERIYFGPAFVNSINDSELEFILLHELMHIVLLHVFRHRDEYDKDPFDYACDIAVNSNILYTCGGDLSKISVGKNGPSMHLAPNGKEGYLYTAEELYEMLRPIMQDYRDKLRDDAESFAASGGGGGNNDGATDGNNDGATDSDSPKSRGKGKNKGNGAGPGEPLDSHESWDPENSKLQRELWMQRMMDATDVIDGMRQMSALSGHGDGIPPMIRRMVEDFRCPQTDWRRVLDDFVQEEITDYSFTPPDRRFSETDFFLPDFNETSDSVKNILFMVDTSGSISSEMVSQAFAEIRGAITQFGGRLEGWLGFFDDRIADAVPFESVEELDKIRPVGGRGTDFGIIFDYVRDHWPKYHDDPPASIVILTDGFADFPEESAAGGIPVLWLINNDVVTPPWGKLVRVEVADK